MSRQKNLKRNLLICLLAGSAVMYTLPLHAATSVVANNALPTLPMVNGQIKDGYGFVTGGSNTNIVTDGLQMNITQNNPNAVIKWGSFDVGGSATVNFKGPESGYNTLNYVNAGGSMSQIYGTINANNNGNIFIVNPAGVQIGNSAQINVGSLYVSNKTFSDDLLKTVNDTTVMNKFMKNGTANADAALMSLGNINANKVTFEGNGRIVIDSERIKNENTNLTADEIFINTNDKNNVVIGYEAYENGSYAGVDKNEELATLNGNGKLTKADGYMWVEDVKQLQAINTNLSGNYALRNSIDATSTANWNEVNGTYAGFNPIGLDETTGKVIVNNNNEYGFTGNFDGLDYNIFGLTINRESEANVGLFGVAHNANINNVTLVGGSITGGSVVGSVIGAALGNTHITNATNSASVTGNTDVGGIVGYSGDEIDNVGDSDKREFVNTNAHFTNLINTGNVYSKGEQGTQASNAGGLIGYMYNGKLDGNSYNLGDVSGKGYNVGGLVGHAVNSTIGDGTNLVYNRLDVEGAYNVGGIVGNMEGTTVQNAENSGNVTATGFMTGKYYYHTANGGTHIAKVDVNVANVGGIAGKADDTVKTDGTVDKKSDIKNVTNSGNVSSSKQTGNDYYDAGNVGGIVGSAVDTNITNATNRENEVRGAHNVGGVAGYFGNSNDNNSIKYTINRGINDGGDIMATGARKGSSFVTEIIRPVNKNQTEEFIIGNIGGIAGYMDGDNVYITGSGNRGTVHTDEPANPANVEEWQKAANVGGIVGKIDRSNTKKLNTNNNIVDANGNLAQAAVSDSYNTGDVLGYTGIGGIAGLMYNGEIASSYNLGYLRSTRQSYVGLATGTTEVVDALNMGGIVGDTTEESNAKALLYDVYNKGQIGDKEFNYFGRHVGGVVGRLSGTVEKAYNTGAIYNGYNVVGGIAGWVAAGTIQNAFNTGNITVYNQNESTSQVGGIAGAANGGGNVLINNVYNLGTLRSFDIGYGKNAVAGILGTASGTGTVIIKNAYTTGNLYSGFKGSDNSFVEDMNSISADRGINRKVSSMYASTEWNANVDASHNTYYIKPDIVNNKPLFAVVNNNTASQAVEFANKSSYAYKFDGQITKPDKTKGSVDDENTAWRIYDGNTPILNAFLPKAEDYFSGESGKTDTMEGITSIQYGTAYDPLLTIIKADKEYLTNHNLTDLSYKWTDLGINNAAGIAVYGAGLTLSGFEATGGTGYFGGTVYADGALTLNGGKNDINLGSAAQIYGSAVNIDTKGKVTIYGDVIATGNNANGATVDETDQITVNNTGNISINAGDVDVYGTLTTGKKVSVPGIKDQAVNTWTPGDVDNPYAEMVDIADRFAHGTTNSNAEGNINITANGTADGSGNVNLYFGNKEEGFITTGGNLTVTGTGDVFVDSDLDIAGNVTLTSTGKDGEVLLTLTNIGKVQADRFMDVVESVLNGKDINYITNNKVDLAEELKVAVRDKYPDLKFDNEQASEIINALITSINNNKTKVEAIGELNNAVAVEYMHDFMESFNNNTENYIALNANSGDAKLTVDMWDGDKFNFKKYDSTIMGQYTFVNELEALEFYINEEDVGNNDKIAEASKHVYVEVDNGEQLKGIQSAGNDALGYNYALMGDINASDVKDYEAIGGENGEFTGTFDGRGNRVIGLDTTKGSNGSVNTLTNAGIFSTVGEGGVVKNVNIYSGNFEGTNTAGSVAGMNSGRIENVTGFGNTVTVTGASGNAGGIVGVNNGKSDFAASDSGASTLTGNGIYDVQNVGSVIAGGNKVVAGGLVGLNAGALGNSYSDSAVTSTLGTSAGLGGIAGVNTGDVQFVDSLGVTNGGTNSDKVGGIIGVNEGNMYSGYNESIVSGKDNVGGIIGVNTNTVSNIVNATGINGNDYVGGLVGDNDGNVSSGRNNGTITGNDYVGGMVGSNGAGSILKNLVNAESADIVGEDYVGGIAGTNSGEITADDQSTLDNLGSITGQNYVGGVAGENIGKIEYIKTNISLNVKDTNEDAQYFGGVAGINGRVDDNPNDGVDNDKTGTITSATNEGNVIAADADYVGGIVGLNTANGQLLNSSNAGRVEGANYVGGVAGKNEASITGEANDLVTIDNSGVVIAHEGGAGGIFGENTGKIGYAELTNNGIVSGTYNADKVAGTGGIIGVNSGDIKHSSLKNNIGGQVIGTQNVGGLIGVNSGNIEGGRNEQEVDKDGKETVAADSYYKYQIYNNGVINVGTWIDGNNNGLVDACEIQGVAEDVTSTNIGGLIGSNEETGILTAGYNTGAINAGSSTNVGGIVGNNKGIVDQVFNTVMVADGATKPDGSKQETAITGGTNVGGLVGTNSGTLSNAYNTTGVEGAKGSTGNAVGVNADTGTITNIYASNISGNLIGAAYNNGKITNAYSFATGDTTATVILGDDQKNSDSYNGFDFDGTNTKSPVWKNYDGSGNPLLKVFLTNLTVNETVEIDGKKVTLKDYLNLVYNGKEQDLNIADLIDKGFITAPNKELLNAYKNTLKDQSNGLGESYLLDNADGQKNAGNYQNDEWLYSNQIHSSTTGSFNPNNLGYDINFVGNDGSITVDRATININLNDIYHTYGDVDNVYSDKDRHNQTSYEDSYTISNWTELDKVLQDYIKKYLNVQFNGSDDAVKGDKTQSVGDYNWSLDFTLGGADASNYQIGENSGNVNSVTITGTDKSHVEKAKLTININDVTMTYGDKETAISGQYGYAASTNVGEKLVNGDSLKDVIVDMGYNNTAYNTDGTTKNVIDGKYALEDKDVIQGNKYGNYEVTINDGEVTMGKAQLVVDINDVTMTYGDKESTISNQYGYTVNNGLVNGDSLEDVIADMKYNNTAYNTDGTTKDVIDGKYALQDKDVTGGSKYGNYEITINDGEVTMGKAQLVVDINNVDMTYGDKESTISNQYGYTVNNGLVNEDSLKDVIADMTYENTAYNADGTTKDVIDGKFALENKDITVGGKYGNYEVTINNGTVMMNKADLNIKVDNANTTVGKMPGELTGTVEGLTNGDTLPTHDFALKDDSLISVSGNHEDVIGIVIGGKFYELGDADWSNGLFANYDVNYEMGDLAVSVVEIPDNWPNNRWDYLFGDNPFDRNENFRERKAEVNFVDGAMEI